LQCGGGTCLHALHLKIHHKPLCPEFSLKLMKPSNLTL
jgi:hypothetical protein